MLRMLLFFLLISSLARAQERPSVRLTVYDEANGGPQGLYNCIFQSTSGFLWFGSSNGLVRYDGYGFTVFRNEKGYSSNITNLTEDGGGRLWMSLAEGSLAKFDPAASRFTNYALKNSSDPTLQTAQIMTLFFDRKARLWIGMAQKGLLLFDTTKKTTRIYPLTDIHPAYAVALNKIYNTVYAIQEDAQEKLWLATHDGLYTLAGPNSALKPIRERPVVPHSFRKDLFNGLVLDGDSIWLGAWAGGLSCYHMKSGKWDRYFSDSTSIGKSTTNIINALALKGRNQLWLSSGDQALGVFDKPSKRFLFFREYVTDPDLPRTEAWGLKLDKDGNAWAISAQRLIKIQVNRTPFYFTSLPVSRSDNQADYNLTDLWENENIRIITTEYADGIHVYDKHSGKQAIFKV
ncbi:MAG TPA: hypothetical protein VHK91_00935, partial [Flavisolibacter sp.]|nr:hypothetical protein [Flavisolibacter sp.]